MCQELGPLTCVVLTVPQKYVNTTVGGNITLLSTYTTQTDSSNLFIQWSFYSAQDRKLNTQALCQYMDEKSTRDCQKMVYVVDARGRCSWRHQIYFSQRGQASSYGEFRGRIQGVNSTGNASITIFNMRASETGIYTCEVFNPADSGTQGQKHVIVSVLVPPAQPHCSLRGTPEMGHLISLYCFSEGGLPSPTYRWDKVSGDIVTPVTDTY
ncbi:PREDICTED: V-set and immunoglobulin domain-containing protein 1-like, partial [Gekko japonicus]|uniref:V-set and immunoglobulin domain-containing protein 1-like n=1 Tax=Gekko japonicus TaxID=146911 RepID=UPI00074FC1A8